MQMTNFVMALCLHVVAVLFLFYSSLHSIGEINRSKIKSIIKLDCDPIDHHVYGNLYLDGVILMLLTAIGMVIFVVLQIFSPMPY